MTWINCEYELPPCDGLYEICNCYDKTSTNLYDVVLARYDGYGFEYDKKYFKPTYWKQYEPPQKKYGKQK
jgi:hypothetical protein